MFNLLVSCVFCMLILVYIWYNFSYTMCYVFSDVLLHENMGVSDSYFFMTDGCKGACHWNKVFI
jgi:hypothetical protein